MQSYALDRYRQVEVRMHSKDSIGAKKIVLVQRDIRLVTEEIFCMASFIKL